jgi:hypothetical protein
MASTITLTNSITWAQQFVKLRPLQFGGTTLEPALTCANTVLMGILGPPFKWRWNRAVVSFPLVVGQQDYPVNAATFGWIETAVIQDLTQTPAAWMEIDSKIVAGRDSASGRPHTIAAQLDNGAGQITFRVLPGSPDQAYPAELTIQKKAVLLTALANTWSPIPDEYSYIYNYGFLALIFLYADDPRFQWANQKFVAHLLAANEGLTETEISIFLNQWQSTVGDFAARAVRAQQAQQARGV